MSFARSRPPAGSVQAHGRQPLVDPGLAVFRDLIRRHQEGFFRRDQLAEGIRRGDWAQVLLGATGTGKTFTAAKLIEAGVPTTYREARGTIHGFINLSQGIPSAKDDIRGALTVLKAIVTEAGA